MRLLAVCFLALIDSQIYFRVRAAFPSARVIVPSIGLSEAAAPQWQGQRQRLPRMV